MSILQPLLAFSLGLVAYSLAQRIHSSAIWALLADVRRTNRKLVNATAKYCEQSRAIDSLLEERGNWVRENAELRAKLSTTQFTTDPPEIGVDCCDECGCTCDTIPPTANVQELLR